MCELKILKFEEKKKCFYWIIQFLAYILVNNLRILMFLNDGLGLGNVHEISPTKS